MLLRSQSKDCVSLQACCIFRLLPHVWVHSLLLPACETPAACWTVVQHLACRKCAGGSFYIIMSLWPRTWLCMTCACACSSPSRYALFLGKSRRKLQQDIACRQRFVADMQPKHYA